LRRDLLFRRLVPLVLLRMGKDTVATGGGCVGFQGRKSYTGSPRHFGSVESLGRYVGT
jgi:hypothetical protein